MDSLIFEEIKEVHLKEVMDIYNYYVINTTVSFHTEAVTLDEMRESVMKISPLYKTFVILLHGKMKGYVLLTQHKNKQAYNSSAEVTIYLKPDSIGQGIGGKALRFLEAKAKDTGFHVLVATICKENERSAELFLKNGYVQCAHFKEVGFKFGRWLDIVSYQKIITDHSHQSE
jgi:L-amino acid N-acyltransferase YncA